MTARRQRRLAAILAADAAGFSRMMEADETETLSRLRAAREEVIEPQVARCNGRIVKTTGDGFLAEFASAVDAVDCAVAIQEAMATHASRLALRIGVNLGDIVAEDSDIFGDGVNVASRLEALASVGGVLIADTVAQQIQGKAAHKLADLGEHSLKNISRRVRIWQWPAEASPALANQADRRGRNPTIAVLPFEGPTDDADVGQLAAGLADSLAAALSALRGVAVLSRAPGDPSADYLLRGSVRRHESRLRIIAEIIFAESGAQIWSSRYEQIWGDVFAIEDALVERIAAAARVAININDGARHQDKPSAMLTNAERRAMAARLFYRFSEDGFTEAEVLLDQALAEDADDSMALAMRAFCSIGHYLFRTEKLDEAEIEHAFALAERAIECDRNSDYAYETRGLLALHLRGDARAALADAQRALAINPQYALGLQLRGEALIYSGEPEEGARLIEKVIDIAPRDPTLFYRYYVLGIGRYLAGDSAGALVAIEEALRGSMRMPLFSLARVAILARTGAIDEARDEAERFRARWPIARVKASVVPPFQIREDRQAWVDALRAAGLPG